MGTLEGSKIIKVPSQVEYNELVNSYAITDDMKQTLLKLYKSNSDLTMYLLKAANYYWDVINRSILRGDNFGYGLPWSYYKIGNISVYEKTLPNTLLEVLQYYGFTKYVSLPEYYQSGALFVYEFIVPSNRFTKNGSEISSGMSIYVGEIIVRDIKNNHYYSWFVSN